jgi:hypothetical protein
LGIQAVHVDPHAIMGLNSNKDMKTPHKIEMRVANFRAAGRSLLGMDLKIGSLN